MTLVFEQAGRFRDIKVLEELYIPRMELLRGVGFLVLLVLNKKHEWLSLIVLVKPLFLSGWDMVSREKRKGGIYESVVVDGRLLGLKLRKQRPF